LGSGWLAKETDACGIGDVARRLWSKPEDSGEFGGWSVQIQFFGSREGRFDIHSSAGHPWAMKSEIIFEVTEAEEGGYCASALGYGITTQAETLEELRAMVRDAVDCYFDDPSQAPNIIRLHFVRDEVLAR
jgi:predicted RNase H-like HicB family nuclease